MELSVSNVIELPSAVKITVEFSKLEVTFVSDLETQHVKEIAGWLFDRQNGITSLHVSKNLVKLTTVPGEDFNEWVDELKLLVKPQIPYTASLGITENAVSRWPQNWWRDLNFYGSIEQSEIERIAEELGRRIRCENLTVLKKGSRASWRIHFSKPERDQRWEQHLLELGVAIW